MSRTENKKPGRGKLFSEKFHSRPFNIQLNAMRQQAANAGCDKDLCHRHIKWRLKEKLVLRALDNNQKLWKFVPESIQRRDQGPGTVHTMSYGKQRLLCELAGLNFQKSGEDPNDPSVRKAWTAERAVRGARLFDAVQLRFPAETALVRLIDLPVEQWPLSTEESFPSEFSCQQSSSMSEAPRMLEGAPLQSSHHVEAPVRSQTYLHETSNGDFVEHSNFLSPAKP